MSLLASDFLLQSLSSHPLTSDSGLSLLRPSRICATGSLYSGCLKSASCMRYHQDFWWSYSRPFYSWLSGYEAVWNFVWFQCPRFSITMCFWYWMLNCIALKNPALVNTQCFIELRSSQNWQFHYMNCWMGISSHSWNLLDASSVSWKSPSRT